MSRPKEPFFFEAEYERGLDYYRKTYFAHWAGEPVVGESRHRNLYLPFVPDRIRASLGSPRFLALLRDPVERAYSEWWHWHSRGKDLLSFEEAVDRDLRRMASGEGFEGAEGVERYRASLDADGWSSFRPYVDVGHYARHLARYVDRFGRDSLKVVLFEDLGRDPRRVMGEVAEFAGLSDYDFHQYPVRNEQRSRMAGRILGRLRRLPGARALPRGWKVAGKRALARLLPGRRPEMSPAVRRRLAEHYRESNEALAAFLGRDLGHWSAP